MLESFFCSDLPGEVLFLIGRMSIMLDTERMLCYTNKGVEFSPMGEKKCYVQSINSQSL